MLKYQAGSWLMPIYEFLCSKCNTTSSILVKSASATFAARCSACGSGDLVRLISRCSYHKSTSTIWEESGEPRRNARLDYYKDPRNIGRWTEKKFKEMGMDMPAQIKEEIDAAREGELPKSLKEKL
jgi:putative FmdB family regulatory protein